MLILHTDTDTHIHKYIECKHACTHADTHIQTQINYILCGYVIKLIKYVSCKNYKCMQ